MVGSVEVKDLPLFPLEQQRADLGGFGGSQGDLWPGDAHCGWFGDGS